MTFSLVIAMLSALIWLYLLFGHGDFWRARDRGDRAVTPENGSAPWPSVTAVVPARNEAEMIPVSLNSLLGQDYRGDFQIVLVDDQSEDGTGQVARAAAEQAEMSDRLAILQGAPLPRGWTGKIWAMHQGIAHATAARPLGPPPDFLLLTDADIAYPRHALTKLVAQARADDLVLNSLMVKLRCESPAEQALIPAFVFFFQMLYPFSWVNSVTRSTAAAAGGCMLVKRSALEAIGGIASIRGALIDDCALGARLKMQGRVFLGLTEEIDSIRPYPRFDDIRRMVARSAYAQLRYSPLLLLGCIIGMAITYLAGPALAIFGSGLARYLGLAIWAMMAIALVPTLRLYRLSPWWGIALPGTAAIYLVFTLDSAYQHWRGRGGMWKGRPQANAASGSPLTAGDAGTAQRTSKPTSRNGATNGNTNRTRNRE